MRKALIYLLVIVLVIGIAVILYAVSSQPNTGIPQTLEPSVATQLFRQIQETRAAQSIPSPTILPSDTPTSAGQSAQPTAAVTAQALLTNPFRAATFDMSGDSDTADETAALIARNGADIVLLQNLDSETAHQIAQALEMDVAFFPVIGANGLAVLARTEMINSDGAILSGSASTSAVQRIQVQQAAGAVITVYNVALGFGEPAGTTAAEGQFSDVFTAITQDYLTGLTASMIIGGRFNTTPDVADALQMKSAGLTDPFAGVPLDDAATLSNENARARIDYLWARGLLPMAAQVDQTAGSDRRIAIVQFQTAQ